MTQSSSMTMNCGLSGRHSILGVKFDFNNYDSAYSTILDWRSSGRRELITITNPHSVLLCSRDQAMREATGRAGLTLPDGIGVILGAAILGYPHQGRVTGPTLMLKLCDWGREVGLRHFFYGGAPGVAEKLAMRMQDQFPGIQISGTLCPPFRELSAAEDEEHIKKINETRPDIVWVGLGAPKQEKWMLHHLGRVASTAMIGVGAAFDFHTGNTPWAPAWVRNCGMEWAWRLACEPRRMWRRNLDSPVFLIKIIKQRIF